jgi:hypothetical protein
MKTLANISQFQSLQPIFNTSVGDDVGMFDPPEKQLERLDAEMLSIFQRYAQEYAEARAKLNAVGIEAVSDFPAFDRYANGEPVTIDEVRDCMEGNNDKNSDARR